MSALAAVRHVLVVDDHADAAESLALLLQREGHSVDVAFDGRDALAQYERAHHDAVIMDIGLPVLDGYECARAMRRVQGDRALLLIALTGWGHPEDRRRSEASGFDHHLVKPVRPSELNALLVAAQRTE
ncbi:MAG: response regulator [Gemmatimonas sp.]|jgi:CheY-like chemotaxis protein|uniref:response regulator n=1 Tax=Gemmatimonas sp. TaxID=1962908 RepID=UPI0022CC098C|nr:response regulator [Gemmatimonas sp.]MCA2982707.1 response regulator [Gemmatimonas sp.]MCA2987552.1 response regulator [Gemmatimonas sp.]MCA2995915.1 response regulator [Gemmatimonas sp.]MCE2954588.1 response regulator [Gemmatimonas sp.]MCZ8012379.1 response regulator [Gemmatimonas sp.]